MVNCEIVEKPSFRVIGKAMRVTTKDGENLRQIPEFWQACLRDGTHDRLASFAAKGVVLGNVTLGICMDFAADMQEFTYMIAAESADSGVPIGMIEKTIPPLTWAAFKAEGAIPEAIQTLWSSIWSDFFPSSGHKHAEGPDLELYPSGNPTQSNYRFEVWVPVERK